MQLLIVGLGSMGKRRARLAGGAGHAVAGVDSSESRRAEAEGLGIESYATIETALAARRYDAAFVCTAPLGHAAISLQLLKAGLPVFSELNLVSDGYAELMQTAKQKNLPLFLSNTMLYRPETAYIQTRVAQHSSPVNYLYHIGQYLPDWHPWESYQNFFAGNAKTSGIREIFAIELPWLLSAFGPAQPVCVQKDKLSGLEISYPDSWFVTLRHQNGTKGVLAADVVSPKAVRHFEAFGEGLHLFWDGSPDTLFEYDAAEKQNKKIATYQSYQHDARYSDNIVENAYLDEMEEFFAVLRGEAEARWSFEKDAAVLGLIDEVENREG